MSLKHIERHGKAILTTLLAKIFPVRKVNLAALQEVNRILIFRLDRRIGNGILLLPLIRAIRETRPDVQVDVLINPTVADLFRQYATHLVYRVIAYDQGYLFRHPWHWVTLIRSLRKKAYALVISSTNPDAFSLSQALLARMMGTGFTLGFRWKNSPRFYDITVPSSTQKHYADAQIDLWRVLEPNAPFIPGGLQVPQKNIYEVWESLPAEFKGDVLFWLGATGDKLLTEDAVSFIYETLLKTGYANIVLVAGPEDRQRMGHLSSRWQEKILYWHHPLPRTAAYFAGFQLFISGDTGPMHLAVAVGVPTVTIFTSTNLIQYGYQDGRNHFALNWKNTVESKIQLETILEKLSVTHGKNIPQNH